MLEIKDIAMYEENDSELVKYHLQQAIDRVKDLKEQIKELFDEYLELKDRIDKAIEYITDGSDFKSIYFKKTDEELWKILLEDNIKNNLLDILRGKDNE